MSLPELIGLDTNCFVYFIEDPETSLRCRYLTREVFGPMADGRRRAITSTLTLAELLVAAHRGHDADRARELRAALEGMPNLEVKAIDNEVASRGAELRGELGGALPDALQVAACLEAGALLTNDRDLLRFCEQIDVLILDDLASDEGG